MKLLWDDGTDSGPIKAVCVHPLTRKEQKERAKYHQQQQTAADKEAADAYMQQLQVDGCEYKGKTNTTGRPQGKGV
eukprot:COSAG06_NODE_4143_length_4529_cov_7.605192_5_plen_75_part_01